MGKLGMAFKLIGKLFGGSKDEGEAPTEGANLDQMNLPNNDGSQEGQGLISDANKEKPDIIQEPEEPKQDPTLDVELIKSKVEAEASAELGKDSDKILKSEPDPKESLDSIVSKYGIELQNQEPQVEAKPTAAQDTVSLAVEKLKDTFGQGNGSPEIVEGLGRIENLLKAQFEYLQTQNDILITTQKLEKASAENEEKKAKIIKEKLKALDAQLHSANAGNSELDQKSQDMVNQVIQQSQVSGGEGDSDEDSSGGGLSKALMTMLGLGLSAYGISKGFDNPLLGKLGIKGLQHYGGKVVKGVNRVRNFIKNPLGRFGNKAVGETAEGVAEGAAKKGGSKIGKFFSNFAEKTKNYARKKIGAAFKKVGNAIAKRLGPKVGPKVITVFTKLGGGLTKVAGKMGAKAGAKGIPIIGNLIGAVFGIVDTVKRAKKGDALGAVIAGIGALMNFFPWGGNYISMALDALNLILDETVKKKGDEAEKVEAEEIDGETKPEVSQEQTNTETQEVTADQTTSTTPEQVTPRPEHEHIEKLQSTPALLNVKPIEAPEIVIPGSKDEQRAKAIQNLEQKPDSANVEAARFITSTSHNRSTGKCARHVSDALYKAGIGIGRGHAYQYPKMLEAAGYERLGEGEKPQVGDISTTPPFGKHKYGHVAMFNGKNWVSDFLQNGKNIYADKPNEVKITSWRKPELSAEVAAVSDQEANATGNGGEEGADNGGKVLVTQPPVVVNAPVTRTVNNITNNYIRDTNLLNLQLGNYDKH